MTAPRRPKWPAAKVWWIKVLGGLIAPGIVAACGSPGLKVSSASFAQSSNDCVMATKAPSEVNFYQRGETPVEFVAVGKIVIEGQGRDGVYQGVPNAAIAKGAQAGCDFVWSQDEIAWAPTNHKRERPATLAQRTTLFRSAATSTAANGGGEAGPDPYPTHFGPWTFACGMYVRTCRAGVTHVPASSTVSTTAASLFANPFAQRVASLGQK